MNLQLHELAEADLINGFVFYEQQGQELGNYFLDSLYSDIESLRLFAGTHRKVFGYHRMLARRFPYSVYYNVSGDTVRIWRVLDCRRNPHWIERQVRRRIGKRS